MKAATELLDGTRVTLCVDTNILIEFKPLDQIPWPQIAPNVTTVRIVVVDKVGKEMDGHKKKTGRLRRRALKFKQIAKQITQSTDGRAVLRERDPRVTIEFGPIYRRTELDSDLYDLDDDDGRIVAEVARFMQDHPDAVFLADDLKPLRWARQTDLRATPPPDSWRREEGPDERDMEIAELKRELGARPAFSISFPCAANDRREHIFEPPPATSCAVCSEQLISAVLAANPKVPRGRSVARYGLAQPDPLRLSMMANPLALTGLDLDRYEDEYANFEERVTWWADNQPELFSALELVLPLGIEIANCGDRAAERVHVELELAGPFHFEPHEAVERFTGAWLTAPSPPRPRQSLHFEPPFVPGQEPSKPHIFYLLDDPESDGSTTRLVWRCEEFRHGESFILPSIVRATKEAARGALKVKVSSAVMAKAVEATAPLICFEENTDNRLCTYLQERVELFPHRYQEPVLRALAVASRGCASASPPADS